MQGPSIIIVSILFNAFCSELIGAVLSSVQDTVEGSMNLGTSPQPPQTGPTVFTTSTSTGMQRQQTDRKLRTRSPTGSGAAGSRKKAHSFYFDAEPFSAAFPRLVLQQMANEKPIKVTFEQESKIVFQRKEGRKESEEQSPDASEPRTPASSTGAPKSKENSNSTTIRF